MRKLILVMAILCLLPAAAAFGANGSYLDSFSLSGGGKAWRYLALDDPTWQQVQIARDPQPVYSLGVASGAGRNVRTGW